jgi:hypothetical protein
MVRGVPLLRAGLIGRLAMACWPQGGLWGGGERWGGSGREGALRLQNESTPQPFGLGRRPVCGGVLSRDILGGARGLVKRDLVLSVAWPDRRSGSAG